MREIFRVDLPKGRVVLLWVRDMVVSYDVDQRHVGYPPYAGQDGLCPLEGLWGQVQVEGHSGVFRLLVIGEPTVFKLLLFLEGHNCSEDHTLKQRVNYADLSHGLVLMLDPNDLKLESVHSHFGNLLGRVTANCAADAVNITVFMFSQDLFIL